MKRSDCLLAGIPANHSNTNMLSPIIILGLNCAHQAYILYPRVKFEHVFQTLKALSGSIDKIKGEVFPRKPVAKPVPAAPVLPQLTPDEVRNHTLISS